MITQKQMLPDRKSQGSNQPRRQLDYHHGA
jgi:hypothetical protein